MEDSKHFQKLRRSSHASDGNDNNEGNNQPKNSEFFDILLCTLQRSYNCAWASW
jgi:hypothetical protein